MLRDCWSDYRHARQSPLWAESYFRCQQLTVFYECGELKQAACIKEEPGYRQISLEIFERVKEACNGNVLFEVLQSAACLMHLFDCYTFTAASQIAALSQSLFEKSLRLLPDCHRSVSNQFLQSVFSWL